MDLWSAPVQLLAEQLPPTGGASVMNRWGYAQSHACRQMAKPSKGRCHSSFQTCSTAPCPASFHSLSAQQICHREKSPPTQTSFRGGRKDRIAAEKEPQVNKVSPYPTGLEDSHLVGCVVFSARTFESDSLSWEPKGQKTSCLPKQGLASLQNVTFTPAKWSFCLIHHWKP